MNFCYRRALVKAVAVLLVLGLAGTACKDASTTASVAAGAKGGAALADLPSSASATASKGTTSSAPKPAPTPLHSTTPSRTGELAMSGGVILPNRALTPGATNPAVTQATIRSTICLTGYTKTIRPPSSYTTALKIRQLDGGYTYRGDLSTSDYEEDHLISLELGGSAAAVKNLWPEPYAATEGARVKDKIENRLHDLVCSGRLGLRVAQQAIASNWWTAYQRYGGAGVPQVWDGTYVAASGSGSTATSAGSSTTAPSGATAQCRDGSYSYSQHRSGTCSHHGGVARWL